MQYNITIGSVEPSITKSAMQTEKGTMALGAMGRYPGLMQTHAKELHSDIENSTICSRPRPLKYDDGRRIGVVRDDLEMFRDHHQIFWVIVSFGPLYGLNR